MIVVIRIARRTNEKMAPSLERKGPPVVLCLVVLPMNIRCRVGVPVAVEVTACKGCAVRRIIKGYVVA